MNTAFIGLGAMDRGMAGTTRLSMLEQTLGDYQRLLDQCHGDEDISALYRIKRTLFAGNG
jgi:hypothetical protein